MDTNKGSELQFLRSISSGYLSRSSSINRSTNGPQQPNTSDLGDTYGHSSNEPSSRVEGIV